MSFHGFSLVTCLGWDHERSVIGLGTSVQSRSNSIQMTDDRASKARPATSWTVAPHARAKKSSGIAGTIGTIASQRSQLRWPEVPRECCEAVVPGGRATHRVGGGSGCDLASPCCRVSAVARFTESLIQAHSDNPEPFAAFRADSEDVGFRLDACGDAELVALVADEQRDALGELYRRHTGWLLLRLRHRCADEGLAAEALQDTFVAVWRGASGYRGSGRGRRLVVGDLDQATHRPVAASVGQEPVSVDLNGEVDVVTVELVLGAPNTATWPALQNSYCALRAVVQATVLDGLTT